MSVFGKYQIKFYFLIVLLLLPLSAIYAGVNERFISNFDNKKYEQASKLINNLNLDNVEVIRRLGLMYYNGYGIAENKEDGLKFFVYAARKKDFKSAINLCKHYYLDEEKRFLSYWWFLFSKSIANTKEEREETIEIEKRLPTDYLYQSCFSMIDLYDEHLEIVVLNSENEFELSSLRNKISAIEQELEEEKTLTKNLNGQKVDFQTEIASLKSEIVELTSENNKLKEKEVGFNECQSQINEKDEEIASLKNQIVELMEQNYKLKKTEADFAKYKLRINERDEKIVQQLKTATENIRNLKEKNKELRNENRELKKVLNKFSSINYELIDDEIICEVLESVDPDEEDFTEYIYY